MELRTARLDLRPLVETDAVALHAFEGDPEVVKWGTSDVRNLDECRVYLDNAVFEARATPRLVYEWGLWERSSLSLIGRSGMLRDSDDPRIAMVWYVLRRDRWGQGYAAEATEQVLRFAFDTLGLHRVIAEIDPGNAASLRVVEKLGMRKEAHLVQNVWIKGGWRDSIMYAVLRAEWIARPQALAR